MYTKTDVREGARVLLSAMQYLEKTYGPGTDADTDMRPWISRDHPIAVAHWILAGRRTYIVSNGHRGPEVRHKHERVSIPGRNATAGHPVNPIRSVSPLPA